MAKVNLSKMDLVHNQYKQINEATLTIRLEGKPEDILLIKEKLCGVLLEMEVSNG